MKPSISSNYLKNLDPYEMASTYCELGYRQTEIGIKHTDYFLEAGEDAAAYRRYIDGLGFSIPQGHLIFGARGDITSSDNTVAVANLKRNLDVFLELGVKAAVIHYSHNGTDLDPIEEWFDQRVKALNELCNYVKGTELVICVENLSRIHDHDAAHLLSLCRAVDNQENIGICLDTGHLHIAGGDQYDFIMQAGKYLRSVHVHDNFGELMNAEGKYCDDRHMMPFDCGTVNWDRLRRGLREVGYGGLFSYELGNAGIPMEIKRLQAAYLLEVYNTYFAF